MKLEVGKRYVLRNGDVTGHLHECRDTFTWMTDQYKSWLTNGGHYNLSKEVSGHDIVAEFREPQPQPEPLRWVENCKPDKPGIWAWKSIDGVVTAHYYGPRCSLSAYAIGTWCYLGPIPEILPPKKKVVQRLWLDKLSTSTADGVTKTTYQEIWLNDDCEIDNPCRMIRTDETREVEQ